MDAKRKACCDVTGRIGSEHRTVFVNEEFGRYKRLLAAVDRFETEARQSAASMTNVWKKVTPQHLKSDFFPSLKRSPGDESRRGSMDAFVAESEEDEDDGDGEEEEEEDDEEEVKPDAEAEKRANGGAPARAAPAPPLTNASVIKSDSSSSSNSKPQYPDVEDLLCLVCGENPRNGGIMHGQYLHFYCCFPCGKRQLRAGMGCLVCDRPIDKVLRLLPLTAEMRKAIQEHK